MKKTKEVTEYNKAFGKEITDIRAVTGPSAFSGWSSGNEKLWTARIGISAWKAEGSQEICRQEHFLTTKADAACLEGLREKIPPNSIVSLRVRKKDKDFLLVDIRETQNADAGLEKILKDQVKPLVYKDERLGKLVLNKSLSLFEGKLKWNTRRIGLEITKYPEKRMKDAIETARALARDIPAWDKRLREFAASKLLKLKNSAWLEEDEKPLHAREFEKRIKPDSVEVFPKGRLEFFFEDGGIFWGHLVVISGSLAKGPTRAEIAG